MTHSVCTNDHMSQYEFYFEEFFHVHVISRYCQHTEQNDLTEMTKTSLLTVWCLNFFHHLTNFKQLVVS